MLPRVGNSEGIGSPDPVVSRMLLASSNRHENDRQQVAA
jgi:hypothetical protein